jgi:hypothetical protein
MPVHEDLHVQYHKQDTNLNMPKDTRLRCRDIGAIANTEGVRTA